MEVLYTAVAMLAAYLLGSVSFAVVVSRMLGLADPRTYGSKNPGATNVLRSGSKAAAVLTSMRVAGGLRSSHRNRSRFTAICRARPRLSHDCR